MRKPALFLEALPRACDDASRRARFTGRTVQAVMVRSLAEVGVCLAALVGGFFADIEGDGDDVPAGAEEPLVCMPGGMGRFVFGVGMGTGLTVTMVAAGYVVFATRDAGDSGPPIGLLTQGVVSHPKTRSWMPQGGRRSMPGEVRSEG